MKIIYTPCYERDFAYPVDQEGHTFGYQVMKVRIGDQPQKDFYAQPALDITLAVFGPLQDWQRAWGAYVGFNPQWHQLPEAKALIPLRWLDKPWRWGWGPL